MDHFDEGAYSRTELDSCSADKMSKIDGESY